MRQNLFEVNREDLERYTSIGFHLALQTLHKDGAITNEQFNEYSDYTCASVTDKSVLKKLISFFDKKENENSLIFKFIAIKLQKTTND